MPKVKYNFLNDYSNLPRFDVNFTVKNLITRTEVVTATYSGSTQDIAADAFTGEFGKLLIEPDFENADRLISDNNYFFDLGDGTISSGLSTTHIYDVPGEYNITFFVTDSAGNFFKSLTEKNIKVVDIIPDDIKLTFDSLSSQNLSEPNALINVTRYNSIVSSQRLSADGFSVNLSVSGNKNPLVVADEYLKDNNLQYKKRSYFIKDKGLNFEVIDSVDTSNTNIFAVGQKVGDLLNLTISKNKLPNSFFIGSSGTGTFRYYED